MLATEEFKAWQLIAPDFGEGCCLFSLNGSTIWWHERGTFGDEVKSVRSNGLSVT